MVCLGKFVLAKYCQKTLNHRPYLYHHTVNVWRDLTSDPYLYDHTVNVWLWHQSPASDALMDCHIISACSFVQLKGKPQESNIMAWTLGNSTASHWYTKCLTGALGRITSTFSETLGFMTTLKSSNCPFKQGCNPQGCTKAYFRPEGHLLHLILRRFDICFDVTLSMRFRVAIDGF